MDPKDALHILIQHSALTQEQKNELSEAAEDMTDEEVTSLGKELAEKRKIELDAAQQLITKLDEFLDATEPLPQ
jgi:hypothetical protein